MGPEYLLIEAWMREHAWTLASWYLAGIACLSVWAVCKRHRR